MSNVKPHVLKEAPALIERIFPAQKVSFEAQNERTAVQSQTLTGLGSYWKGRKPLILVRATILASLLPPTNDAEADLAIFEKLMALDEESLARRAVSANAFSAAKLQELLSIPDPERYFKSRSWRRGVSDEDKLTLYRQAMATLPSYEHKASVSKRPEELEEAWLSAPIWNDVNKHYAHLGVNVSSLAELVEQFGTMRYGRRPRVGDTFCGGGSIPFEAARIGCDSYASDLNPIACMLTWGGAEIVGAPSQRRKEIALAQSMLATRVDARIEELGIEHDADGNRAKAYLWCLEARCPETDWMVPLSPTWVVSKSRNAIARLRPDTKSKRFIIEVESGVTEADMRSAESGTVQDGDMVYTLAGKEFRTPIKTLRGDFRQADGTTGNRLRRWERQDFKPQADDIFQERLYAIQWITKATLDSGRQETSFAAPTEADLQRERRVDEIVGESLKKWQDGGLVPDMLIDPGEKTDEPIRTRGWTHWHHLFCPRQILVAALVHEEIRAMPDGLQSALSLSLAKMLDWSSKLCRYGTGAARESIAQTFYNQAYNTNYFYGVRSFFTGRNYLSLTESSCAIAGSMSIRNKEASNLENDCDIWITDPPYADAVNYHEIAEFFIAWLRKKPPKPFDEWVWDSRRALAVKGSGEDFRRGMVRAYNAMATHMPDNGMQVVMFTHQDGRVWADMAGIFWAAGLQVTAAWYIATETTSELKEGGYVQGTVILVLRKRTKYERAYKDELVIEIRQEVQRQIETMVGLNQSTRSHGRSENLFEDADLQMAGYAAALRILTSYIHIDGTDMTREALRPRVDGERSLTDEVIDLAVSIANEYLVPEGLDARVWERLNGSERFYLRMLDVETTGAKKLDSYQNFAKAFKVPQYQPLMHSVRPNDARLKSATEFGRAEFSGGFGASMLRAVLYALMEIQKDVEPDEVTSHLRDNVTDYFQRRDDIAHVALYLASKLEKRRTEEASAARVLNGLVVNERVGA